MNLDINDTLSSYLNKLLSDNEFHRTDALIGCTSKSLTKVFINYSDHLPLWLSCTVKSNNVDSTLLTKQTHNELTQCDTVRIQCLIFTVLRCQN